MIRVHTGSRLHFGVFSFGGLAAESAGDRYFGGVGLMIEEPKTVVTVAPTDDWSVAGTNGERAMGFARQFASSFPAGTVGPHHIEVEAAAPSHAGLGSGTQLGLAVARALAQSAGIKGMSVEELARRTGRGKRSALGIHGFAQGGFLVEAGKQRPDEIAPLVARVDFPETWRLLLAIPGGVGLHGPAELDAFRRLQAVPLPTEALCRLALLGMLPALVERDLDAFGEALYEFNHKVGEAFAAVQGGPYAGARVTEIVDCLRREGVRGVAQSSWGPSVCGIVGDPETAVHLQQVLQTRQGLSSREVMVSVAMNHP